VSKPKPEMDPALLAVLANRFDAIVREMTTTLLRTGRSAVIAVARDFSCAIATADDQLLAAAEGLPVHVFGAHLQTAAVHRAHPEMREGDAFLDNDPYGSSATASICSPPRPRPTRPTSATRSPPATTPSPRTSTRRGR
jgi:N-methylhydantoinase B/oxoprolinase/acetone carboxylase alpha subunit